MITNFAAPVRAVAGAALQERLRECQHNQKQESQPQRQQQQIVQPPVLHRLSALLEEHQRAERQRRRSGASSAGAARPAARAAPDPPGTTAPAGPSTSSLAAPPSTRAAPRPAAGWSSQQEVAHARRLALGSAVLRCARRFAAGSVPARTPASPPAGRRVSMSIRTRAPESAARSPPDPARGTESPRCRERSGATVLITSSGRRRNPRSPPRCRAGAGTAGSGGTASRNRCGAPARSRSRRAGRSPTGPGARRAT